MTQPLDKIIAQLETMRENELVQSKAKLAFMPRSERKGRRQIHTDRAAALTDALHYLRKLQPDHVCAAIRQQDEWYCAKCDRRWSDDEQPPCEE